MSIFLWEMQNYNDSNTGVVGQLSSVGNIQTGSMLFSNSSPATQHAFPHQWPDITSWPKPANQSHNYKARYPGSEGEGYHLNSQQDFVPFDEGENFYNDDGDEAPGRELHFSAHKHIDHSRNETNHVIRVPLAQEASIQGAVSTNSLLAGGTGQNTSTAANDRAAELRAKLIAQQRASTTPTLLSSNRSQDTKSNRTQVGKSQTGTSQATLCRDQKTTENQGTQSQHADAANDKSSKQSPNLSLGQNTSDADIDVLIAHGKAYADAKKLSNDRITDKHMEYVHNEGTLKHLVRQEKERLVADDGAPRESNDDASSTGASELGEIREDPHQALSAHQSSKPNSPVPFVKLNNKESMQTTTSSRAKLNTNHVPSISTGKTESQGSNTQNMQTLISSRHLTQSDKEDRTRFRPGKYCTLDSTGLSQADIGQSHINSHQPPKISSRPKLKDSFRGLPYRDEGSDPSLSTSNFGNGIEREVLEMNDGARSQHISGSRSESIWDNKSATKETSPEVYNPSVNATSSAVHEVKTVLAANKPSITATRETTASDRKTMDGTLDVQPSDHVARINPSIFANQQLYEDISDWLEITGYFNVSHRTKRLEIHRKKKALEFQRAELEREEQLELEQHSRSIRASSAYPVINLEPSPSAAIFSPQTISPSSSNMPPPPLPSKEDLGMKIKDSASRETFTSRNIEVDEGSSRPFDNRKDTVPASKRQRPNEIETRLDGQTGKIRRLDAGAQPQDKKSLKTPIVKNESLESRISRDNEPRSAGYRRRSRSPERRRRSLSPPQRRASDTTGYYGHRREWPRADLYSPSTSRHVSPTRRNSDAREVPAHRDAMHPDSQYEASTPEERGSNHQHYAPSNYRGHGRGKGFGFSGYRSGHRSYSGRVGGQGATGDSQALNLDEGS